ncbi:MAG: hypothetical protein ACI9EF_001634 [Pseudohongiellaceae bacterium]|jgi:hypothetical protein
MRAPLSSTSFLSSLLTPLLGLALLGTSGCATVTEASPADADETQASDSGEAAEAAADESSDKSAAGEAAAAKPADKKDEPAASEPKAEKSAPKKDKKDEKSDEEKRDEAQKKWDKVIDELEESRGFFTTWSDEDKLLLELDEKSLGRQFLYWANLLSGLGNGNVYRGAMLSDSGQVLRFDRRGKKHIVLMAENTNYFPGDDAQEQRALESVLSEGFIKSFDIAAELEHEDKLLIDLGSWLKSDVFKVAQGITGSGYSANSKLSLIDEIKAYPRNVEVLLDMVYSSSKGGQGNSTMADGRGVQVSVAHSFVALPEDGFKSREFDQRVGYFYTERKNIFDRLSGDPVTRFANRWRLVKKDPTADVSEPVEPIVYWVDNNTPKEYRGAVKEAIESWEPAFRMAGFINGIVAKQMPDDAEWDAASVDHAVVQWSDDENIGFAIGPSRVDPRTGETMDADITMQATFLNIYAQRFDVYVAEMAAMTKEDLLAQYAAAKLPPVEGMDARSHQCLMQSEERAMQVAFAASVLPFVDTDTTRKEFLYAMIREVAAHEVGHTLGMRHNFKASTWRGLDSLGDDDDTMDTGITGSYMDYPAVNIAAPGETQGEFFQSHVGPNDIWTIQWGYTEFGSNADKRLEKIAAQSADAGLDFGTDEDSFIGDALCVTWDMGSDPVAFAQTQLDLVTWGLEAMDTRAAKDGDAYNEYARYYSRFDGHFRRQLSGLQRFIGGYTFNRDLIGQENGRQPIIPVDAALQKSALDMMVDTGLSWSGGIPDEQRLKLANLKYGPFGSWFDFWSFDPIPRLVNRARFSVLIPLMDTTMFERLNSQKRFTKDAALEMHAVANRVFAAVWGDAPDEYDLWTQADWVNLCVSSLERDSTPPVTAMFDSLLRRASAKLAEYQGSNDPAVAAHGQWLSGSIERYRNRTQTQVLF